ncbi:MAG: CrcB family protein [Hydrogenibacillus sp.]|nr:CrcB family protein [Hydrogenibacillus sp.]
MRASFQSFIGVGVFGASGALLRAGASAWFPAYGFPWSTFAVNVVGAFALGWLAVYASRRQKERCLLFCGTGFLGGLTTYSTMSAEAWADMMNQKAVLGVFYLLLSAAIGLMSVALGRTIAERVLPPLDDATLSDGRRKGEQGR